MPQVLNHVLLHQTIIGEEALKQFAKVDDYPDIIVGCTGGGSNFAGLAFPFIRENLTKGKKTIVRGAEPASCPSLTRGEYRYDFGDSAGMTPLMKMHTLGHDFVPDPIHAGGLRYHGMVRSQHSQFAREKHCNTLQGTAHLPRVRTWTHGCSGGQPARLLRCWSVIRTHRRHRSRARAHTRPC